MRVLSMEELLAVSGGAKSCGGGKGGKGGKGLKAGKGGKGKARKTKKGGKGCGDTTVSSDWGRGPLLPM